MEHTAQGLAVVDRNDFLQAIYNQPDEVFSSYASRTAEEIQVLAQAWKEEQNRGADISSDGVLQTFLHHLEGKKVPKGVIPPVDSGPSDRAWASLNGLAVGFSPEFATKPELRTRLVSAWPGIFQWCRYFYDRRVSVEKDSTQAQNAVLTICNTIRHLYTDTELQTKIRATSGIITLCTRLCLHPASPMEAFIPLSLLRVDTWGKMDEVVTAVGGKPDVVAKAILGRLRNTITQQPMPPDADRSSTLIFLLTTFIVLPRHPLAFAILADNGAWVVARMLFLISNYADSPTLRPTGRYFPCINSALNFLRAALLQSDSPRLVAQAIDAGLLRTVCALSLVFDMNAAQRKNTSLQFILREILPKSMMYRSVIKAMKREHKELDPEFPDETIMRTYLRENWMSLTLLLYMRGGIAKLPKVLKGTGAVCCESVTCDEKGRKSEFLRCGGCLCVYYCGKTCQANAWSSHRTMCKLKKSSQTTGGQLMFSPENAQFIREVIIADAHLHNPHLRKLAKRKFPNEPGENLITCIDYTNPKYPAGTCSLKNINTYVFPPVSSEAADPANVKAQNDEMLKTVRRNPSLYTFIEGTFAYGEQRLTRNVVLSTNMWVNPPSADLHSGLNWQNNKCENQDESAVPLLDLFLALNIKYADS
ncbi:hypothetical protein C8F04DRAFT_1149381 [Mycena alexandri]|uniref:MYND-type domain-containing protein n=1 Tax=Mycena alexandri TaxID=1745969 RepID=A0AAD6S2X3_9AGAR|nr:hypothetical protein C8F04DRAFT_1149381 [Mycena alexandri]